MSEVCKPLSNSLEVRLRGVKRYVSKGVTYTYHRDTGIRLPDIPYDSPQFQSALRRATAAAATQSESVVRWGLAENVLDIEIDRFRPPESPDAIAFNVPQAITFVYKARPAQVMFYHVGDLSNDARREQSIKDRQRYVRLAADFGALSLRQSRVDDGITQYYAIRTAETLRGMPSHALDGTITPDEYTALHAINERQGSISVTRCIRNEVGIPDSEATDLRNAFIRRGWLSNGRPPELTPLGLSLLT